MDTNNLERLISRLERLQQALDLPDQAFVARYQEWIGSTKTWRQRLCARDFKDLDLPKWEKQLQQLVSKLDGGSTEVENYFVELPFARQMEALVSMVRSQISDRRNVYALATTGVGKSIFAKRYVQRNPRDCVYVRMYEQCRNHQTHITARLAHAVGIRSGMQGAETFNQLIDKLQADPCTIFVDEAHSGGHKLMQVIKTLIDETPARFVQLAYPTEFDRVRSATVGALDEAKQLIGRTVKPIFDDYREGLRIADVHSYLRCAGLEDGDAKDVAHVILPMVRANGNYRVLADAVESARLVSGQAGKQMDAVTVRKAVEAQCPRR